MCAFGGFAQETCAVHQKHSKDAVLSGNVLGPHKRVLAFGVVPALGRCGNGSLRIAQSVTVDLSSRLEALASEDAGASIYSAEATGFLGRGRHVCLSCPARRLDSLTMDSLLRGVNRENARHICPLFRGARLTLVFVGLTIELGSLGVVSRLSEELSHERHRVLTVLEETRQQGH